MSKSTLRDKVLHLLELTGDLGLVRRTITSGPVVNGMFMMLEANPAIPPEVLRKKNEIMTLLADELIPKLTGQLVQDYEGYYTEEEIDQLLLFYSSPVGKKCSAMPAALEEVRNKRIMETGQSLGLLLVDYVEKLLNEDPPLIVTR